MLNRISPERLDDHYRGYKLALWLFVSITFMKIAISLVHIAQSVVTIPLGTYGVGAAQNVVALFARMGLDQLFLGFLFGLVLLSGREQPVR